jgi:hypothetical protein
MKNPLREMSRPKAIGLAGIVAGAVAISGAAAAVNVGLLTGNDSAPFTPKTVAAQSDGTVATSTSTTEPPVEIVYQDVYEQAPAVPGPPPAATPAPVVGTASDDDAYDEYEDDDDYDDYDEYEDDDDHEDDDDDEFDD